MIDPLWLSTTDNVLHWPAIASFKASWQETFGGEKSLRQEVKHVATHEAFVKTLIPATGNRLIVMAN